MTSLTKNRRASRITLGGLLTVGLIAGGTLSAQAVDAEKSAARGATSLSKPVESTSAVPSDSFGNIAETPATREGTPLPPLVSELTTEIFLGENVMPHRLAVSPDGTTAYVTSLDSNTFFIVDLTTRTLKKTIELPGITSSEISISADGTRAVVVVGKNLVDALGVIVLDLTTETIIELQTPFEGTANDIVLTADGSSYYLVEMAGGATRVETATGKVLASQRVPTNNASSGILTPDESRFIMGRSGQGSEGAVYTIFDAETLEIILDAPQPTRYGFAGFGFDRDPNTLYSAGGSAYVGILDPATGIAQQRMEVGSIMVDAVGDDSLNRAYSVSLYWDMIMAADFNTGKRSESVRENPHGGSALVRNPVTKELISADRGFWHIPGSTITVVNRPSVSDPADVTIGALGEEVTFSSIVTGVKRGHGGGVIWQSSPDGETWTDIEGAVGNDLTVTVTAENLNDSYRLRFNDDFWGIRGESAPAKALADGPVITLEDTRLPAGVQGEAYGPVSITASGQSDLSWSIGGAERALAGLPAGLELDPATGVLSGTPTAAGDYAVTITVTDSLGSASRAFDLSIAASTAPVEPEVPGTPAPGATTPGGTVTGGGTTAGGTGTSTAGDTLARTGAELTWPALAGGLGLLLAGAYALRRRNA
ncbi:putative Ig domain-containing protein [Mycetocola spongiae]|uniref:putative Ig domain-containing protein n=1 Tax=Mycetocola spongiae TaxID=2859226 RepID=UPI001CF3F9ED|nr:putative Ig domain-containing protein [Mycetocola spongiae]UCR90246.1 putative Ig domain-containing protein [Mycetocola spongiae]